MVFGVDVAVSNMKVFIHYRGIATMGSFALLSSYKIFPIAANNNTYK